MADRRRRATVLAFRDRLLAAASVAAVGCSSQGSAEVAIPAAGSAQAVQAVDPAPTALAMPSKSPAEEAWSAGGAVCMPPHATNQDQPNACGGQPGGWINKSTFGCPSCSYWLDDGASQEQSRQRKGRACCYHVERYHHHYKGRPLDGPDGAVLASGGPGLDWSPAELRASTKSPRTRRRLAERWRRDALEEHASVAAFARLSLSLLLLGAPAELVRLTHEAALDEIEHARLSFAVARSLSGEEAGPGALPIGAASPPATTLLALFRETLRGGCVGETLAALEAGRAAAREPDPAIRGVLLRVARDEERHAELAVRIVAWAMRAASDGERAGMAAALDDAARARPLGGRSFQAAFDAVVEPLLGSLSTQAQEMAA